VVEKMGGGWQGPTRGFAKRKSRASAFAHPTIRGSASVH
jgi:hypothetical protein